MLDDLLGVRRGVFEHFSHDACVLPMSSYPWWQRQFARKEAQVKRSTGCHGLPTPTELAVIRQRVAAEGPLSTSAFESAGNGKAMWSRPLHKRGLDYLWHAGVLATAYRKHFIKFYDLAERVIPQAVRNESPTDQEQVDWLCRSALERLVFASAGDLQRFWDAVDLQEARDWLARTTDAPGPGVDRGSDVMVGTAQGEQRCLRAVPDLQARLAALNPPTSPVAHHQPVRPGRA